MIVTLALTLAAIASTQTPDCSAVRAALPQSGICIEGNNGIALASNEAAARAMLAEARTGEQRFRAAFGREPSPYALLAFEDSATVGESAATLRTMGFATVLPLPSVALQERQMAEATRGLQVSGGTGTVGRVVRATSAGGRGEPRDANFIPHELGHKWYSDAFWPVVSVTTVPATRQYGSIAPDWLDEAAAMLMEDETGRLSYNQRLADGRSRDAQLASTIPPEISLATLTSMIHPAMANMPAPNASAAPGSMVVTSGPSLFYSEVRVFTDYLIDRSGDPRILAAISDGLRGGIEFDSWLGEQGAEHRLPPSIAEMQADWSDWLDHRFGAAADER